MKCFIENFLELDIDELLAVNGGYGSSTCNNGGNSGGYGNSSGGGYGSSSASSKDMSSWEYWIATKDGKDKDGNITRPYDPYSNTQRNSGSYKATSFVPEISGGEGVLSAENESCTLNGSIEGFLENINTLVDGYYVYGGNDPEIDGGVDCSGSVLWAINQEGNNIPDQTANGIYHNNELIDYIDAADIGPGDLRFLLDEDGNAYHVQVILDSQGTRFNATGGPDNTIENPGSLDVLPSPLPGTGVYGRLNFED